MVTPWKIAILGSRTPGLAGHLSDSRGASWCSLHCFNDFGSIFGKRMKTSYTSNPRYWEEYCSSYIINYINMVQHHSTPPIFQHRGMFLHQRPMKHDEFTMFQATAQLPVESSAFPPVIHWKFASEIGGFFHHRTKKSLPDVVSAKTCWNHGQAPETHILEVIDLHMSCTYSIYSTDELSATRRRENMYIKGLECRLTASKYAKKTNMLTLAPVGSGHIIIWLVVSTPLKNMKVKWDDYSQYMEKSNMFQTTNQPLNPIKQPFW